MSNGIEERVTKLESSMIVIEPEIVTLKDRVKKSTKIYKNGG